MKKKDKDVYDREESEENVYSGDVREEMVEGDEISPEEEGFMAGYDEANKEAEENEEKKKKEDDEDED